MSNENKSGGALALTTQGHGIGDDGEVIEKEDKILMTADTPNSNANAKYRIVERNDIIETDDEWLDDDCERWHKVRDFSLTRRMVGLQYYPEGYVPFRRLKEQK